MANKKKERTVRTDEEKRKILESGSTIKEASEKSKIPESQLYQWNLKLNVIKVKASGKKMAKTKAKKRKLNKPLSKKKNDKDYILQLKEKIAGHQNAINKIKMELVERVLAE